jgi:hypothetical protein
MNIFIVKSFGCINGYTNLKAFDCESEAENYAKKVESHISPESLASGDESVEVETLTLENV